jgi:predicted RNA-binding Zn ribbon-like protein
MQASGKQARKHSPNTVPLLGLSLCLELANSVGWSADDRALPDTDVLGDPAGLAAWGRRLGLLGGAAPVPAVAELRRVRELRVALHLTFSDLGRAEQPDPVQIEVIRAEFSRAVFAGDLVRDGDAWRFSWPEDNPRSVRFAAVTDAMILMHTPTKLARVKRCPGRDCGWLFLDTSGRRRWCSMQTCGSRAKVRRHYEKRRHAGGDATGQMGPS